jgi:hypothetical protein
MFGVQISHSKKFLSVLLLLFLMIRKTHLALVLLGMALLSAVLLLQIHPGEGQATFKGVCVRSSSTYSLLFNGSKLLFIPKELDVGTAYRITGIIKKDGNGLKASGKFKVERLGGPTPWMETLNGSYWERGNDAYVLTPEWVRLVRRINVEKGSRVLIWGVQYGSVFYSTGYVTLSEPTGRFQDGFPVLVRGIIIESSRETVLWDGGRRIYLHLPYGEKLTQGSAVWVLGRARVSYKLELYVDSMKDVRYLGMPGAVKGKAPQIGELVEGNCTVTEALRTGLRLNCTDFKLKGFQTRAGDRVSFIAIRDGTGLRCINCTVSTPRELLPNSICNFSEGSFARISGKVEWVKKYRSGFGVANVSSGECWVLLKLPKSLDVEVEEGENITAYGRFTLYRGEPAFSVESGDDVCSWRC